MKRTVNALENVFSNICTSCSPFEWNEDHISFLLMQELRKLFSNRRVRFNHFSKIVAWRSFKNRGTAEINYGDISLIVNVQFSSGEYLRGVANIEAKRSFNSSNFQSIDLAQLTRLKNNLPYSHLLLYNQYVQKLPLKFPHGLDYASHFFISPINTALELLNQLTPANNSLVLRTSFPFTMFLTSRIFWGLDLDFRDNVRQEIINGINKIINPGYLAVINIYYDGQRPIDVELSDIWQEIE